MRKSNGHFLLSRVSSHVTRDRSDDVGSAIFVLTPSGRNELDDQIQIVVIGPTEGERIDCWLPLSVLILNLNLDRQRCQATGFIPDLPGDLDCN